MRITSSFYVILPNPPNLPTPSNILKYHDYQSALDTLLAFPILAHKYRIYRICRYSDSSTSISIVSHGPSKYSNGQYTLWVNQGHYNNFLKAYPDYDLSNPYCVRLEPHPSIPEHHFFSPVFPECGIMHLKDHDKFYFDHYSYSGPMRFPLNIFCYAALGDPRELRLLSG